MGTSSQHEIDQNKVSGILKETFGFDEFRFEQKNVIQSILQQQDTLAIMPTGGGKSLCYQLPALYFDGLTVVISPLISLMHDQVSNLKQHNIDAEFLNSSLGMAQKRDIEERLIQGKIKLLYIAPEGILNSYIMNMLKNMKISCFAIDEAHCVSQWGHEFRKDYTRLNELKEYFPNVPTIALTATADKKTREDICQQLSLNNPNIYISTFDRPNIRYAIYERKNEIRQLDQFIKLNHPTDVGIVYCLSRKKVEKVAEDLTELGYAAHAYHAGLSPQRRMAVQEKFNKDDHIIIVATIAFGMGIDRPDVRYVAHLDLPKSIESYYQETGRAGRDGEPSNAWMMYGLQDVVKLNQMLELTDADDQYKRNAKIKLDAMLSLSESLQCRRKILLNYFGQEAPDTCDNCDACLEPQETWDATIESQKLMSTIYRTGQIFGSSYLIQVLRGSANAKILERGHDKLSVYGIGKDLSGPQWNSVIRQLLSLKYICIKNWEYRSLALTPQSSSVLKSKEKLTLRKLKEQKVSSKGISKKKKAKNFDHKHPDLFEKLRVLRRSIADENKIPPFMVFSDKTLHDMCLIYPRNPDDMMMVHGIGASKLEKYGDVFLNEISSYRQ
ncbi:MAG: DNA helicase RecQ [Bdellovibrionaceae bacterium]|jgi:ATP-dependent DNA helicase RecQ|nr:DNA helicase RecQ [Pseudobdellovibrionaceae bacterium]